MRTDIIVAIVVVLCILVVVYFASCSCTEHLSQIDPANPAPPAGKSVVLSDGSGTLESLDIRSLLYLAVPQGVVVAWSGEVSKIPTGWKLCDGNNGQPINGINIPDLRGRFVVGVAPGKYEMKATGGSDSHTLTIDQMPRHTHTIQARANGDGWCNTPPCGLKSTDRQPQDDKYAVITDTSPMTTIAMTGSGQAFDIRPLYYALAYIIKV